MIGHVACFLISHLDFFIWVSSTLSFGVSCCCSVDSLGVQDNSWIVVIRLAFTDTFHSSQIKKLARRPIIWKNVHWISYVHRFHIAVFIEFFNELNCCKMNFTFILHFSVPEGACILITWFYIGFYTISVVVLHQAPYTAICYGISSIS